MIIRGRDGFEELLDFRIISNLLRFSSCFTGHLQNVMYTQKAFTNSLKLSGISRVGEGRFLKLFPLRTHH
jgi:hypothetical protein